MIMINDEEAQSKMETTMHEILTADKLLTETKKDNLRKEILDIEHGIKTAGPAGKKSEKIYKQASPELANKLHKDAVFMRRDLAKKKAEYEGLNN